MLRIALLALALVGGLWAPALAQVQNDLSGNETWNAGQGPGGPGGDITSAMVRGGTNIAVVAITGNHIIGSTTGSAPIVEGGNLVVTGVPATANITFPPNPVVNGAIIGICNGTAVLFTNVLTPVANTGQTLVSPAAAALAAGTCMYFQFRRLTATSGTWYRVS